MPDITKCEGQHCDKKDICYRYTSKPSEYRQAYFMTAPINRETNVCEHLWKVKDTTPGKD
jgi:hypothetical protein